MLFVAFVCYLASRGDMSDLQCIGRHRRGCGIVGDGRLYGALSLFVFFRKLKWNSNETNMC